MKIKKKSFSITILLLILLSIPLSLYQFQTSEALTTVVYTTEDTTAHYWFWQNLVNQTRFTFNGDNFGLYGNYETAGLQIDFWYDGGRVRLEFTTTFDVNGNPTNYGLEIYSPLPKTNSYVLISSNPYPTYLMSPYIEFFNNGTMYVVAGSYSYLYTLPFEYSDGVNAVSYGSLIVDCFTTGSYLLFASDPSPPDLLTVTFNIPEHGNIFVGIDNSAREFIDDETYWYNKIPINETFDTLTVAPNTVLYLYGVANTGYYFDHWSINDGEIGDSFGSDELSGYGIEILEDITIDGYFEAIPEGYPPTFDAIVNSQRGANIIVNINGDFTTIEASQYYETEYYTRFDNIPMGTHVWIYADELSSDWQFTNWIYTEYGNYSGTIINNTSTETDNPDYFNGLIYTDVNYYTTIIYVSCNVVWSGDGTPPPDPTDTPINTPSPSPNTPFEPIIPLDTGLALFGGIFVTMLFAILFAVLAGKDGLIAGLVTGLFVSVLLGLLPIWTMILVIILGAWMILDKSGVTDRFTGGN